jgi:hypothetical protein
MMTVQIHFGFLCGVLGRFGTAYLKKEFRDFPIPAVGSTIAVGDSGVEYSGVVESVVIDPEIREASVFVKPDQFEDDELDEYESAIEFMKARGWQ